MAHAAGRIYSFEGMYIWKERYTWDCGCEYLRNGKDWAMHTLPSRGHTFRSRRKIC